MKPQFNTTDFEFAHGRKPRGSGTWAFFFKRNAPVSEAFFVHGVSFAEAKRVAASEARRRNVSEVFVGS